MSRSSSVWSQRTEAKESSSGPHSGQPDTERGSRGKLLSPERRRRCVEHVISMFDVSERRACKVLRQPRSSQRYEAVPSDGNKALTEDIVTLTSEYGRYGYRRVMALLHYRGWQVNHKRVERIWRREGLKVPQKQPKRGRLWMNDDSCIRLRPTHPNHVWAYDFVLTRTHDGRAVRLLTMIDEYQGVPCYKGWKAYEIGRCASVSGRVVHD